MASGAASIFGAIGLGSLLIGGLKNSPFFSVAFSIITMMAILRWNVPAIDEFLHENSRLTYLLPYVIGAGLAGLSREAAYHKFCGAAFLAIALIICARPSFVVTDTRSIELNLGPGQNSTRFAIPPGHSAILSPTSELQQTSLRMSASSDPVFTCEEQPWTVVKNKFSETKFFYFVSCRASPARIRITINPI